VQACILLACFRLHRVIKNDPLCPISTMDKSGRFGVLLFSEADQTCLAFTQPPTPIGGFFYW
jgi:hypothetical protein